MDGFRERLNRNDGREYGRGGGRGRDYEQEGQSRNGGRDDRRNGGNADNRWAPHSQRGFIPDTPTSSDPTGQRIKNQSWDSTPSSSLDGAGASNGRPRQSWDSTPRSSREPPSTRGPVSARDWDTPRTVRASYGDESPGLAAPPSSALDEKEWAEEQTRLDRDWYNQDEGGAEILDDDSGFNGYDDYDLEAELVKKGHAAPKKRVSARQAHYQAENDAWQDNQLALSGVTGERRKLDFDNLDDDEETKVHLLVHDLKPPFLDGRLAFTKQLDPINPIKDPTSDLAVFSKKGSMLVAERRAQKERERAAAKVAALAGTTLGNLTGVKEEMSEEDKGEL